MKFIMIVLTLITTTAIAGTKDKKFSRDDYTQVIEDTGVTFTFSAQAQRDFDFLQLSQNSCDKAILASIARTVFDQAAEDGVDYPETIDISAAQDASPMPGVEVVKVQMYDNSIFTIRIFGANVPCLAGSASVSR